MRLKLQKRLATSVLKTGKRRAKFNLERLPDIKEAITKSDIRKLISEKAIVKEQKKGHSRSRARYILVQKSKGRRKGRGSKKGKATSHLSRKERWVLKIRSQRKLLKELKDKKRISNK